MHSFFFFLLRVFDAIPTMAFPHVQLNSGATPTRRHSKDGVRGKKNGFFFVFLCVLLYVGSSTVPV